MIKVKIAGKTYWYEPIQGSIYVTKRGAEPIPLYMLSINDFYELRKQVRK